MPSFSSFQIVINQRITALPECSETLINLCLHGSNECSPPPEIFDPARTHCPSCNATLNALADSCNFCGFSAHLCVQRYPFTPPALDRFVDPDGSLSPADRRSLSRAIRRLEKRFPQITVTVASMSLPESVDGREFGYWFLNRSATKNDEEARRRLHHILVLIDRTSSTVSITVGYGLDCFLDDQFLFTSLDRVSTVFRRRGATGGICAWLKHISNELLPVQREAKFARERWSRHVQQVESSTAAAVPAQPSISQAYHEVNSPRPESPIRRASPPAVSSHDVQ